MASLQPVDFDPFASPDLSETSASPTVSKSTGPNLIPVEGNPFSAPAEGLQPIEGNPFGTPPKEPATFGQAFGRGVDQLQGMLYGAAEATGEATGIQGLKEFGKEGRVANVQEAQQYPPKQEFLKASSPGDYAQWAKETIAELIPSVGTSLAGGAAGAVVGGVPGAIVGAAVPSMLLGTGEVQGTIKEKSPTTEAPGWAFGGGAVIGALDSIVPGKIGSKLVGRFGAEIASEIATKTLEKAAQRGFTRETLTATGIEGITEALQEAVEEVASSGALDKTPDYVGLPTRMVEAGAAGALGGAVFGGGAHLITGGGAPHERTNAPASDQAIQDTLAAVTPKTEPGVAEPSTLTELASAPAPLPPTFYSVVRKVAEDRLPNAASAEQMLNTLKNAEGVKPEELQALGLDEWLARQVGKVSKHDVIAEIEANAIQVQDIVHEENPLPNLRWVKIEDRVWDTSNAPGWRIRQTTNIRDEASYRVINPQNQEIYAGPNLEAAQGEIVRQVRGPATTQYRDYTLPGGENYREHLMTLPVQTEPTTVGPKGWAETNNSRSRAGSVNYQSPHFEESNILAHFRTTDRVDSEGKRVLFVEEIQSDWHQMGRKVGYGVNNVRDQFGNVQVREGPVADAPFKTSWPELAFKRILRLAADEGYDRVAWTPGRVQTERYRLGQQQAKGQSDFYDKMIPQIADKWARKLGAKTGVTEIAFPYRAEFNTAKQGTIAPRFIEVPAEAATRIQQGLPLFSETAKGVTLESNVAQAARLVNGRNLTAAARQGAFALGDLARSMDIRTPITVRLVDSLRGSLGLLETAWANGKPIRYIISIAVPEHATPEALFATTAHEFGHLITFSKFHEAPAQTQILIQIAYEKFRSSVLGNRTFADMVARRDNFISMTQDLRRLRGRDQHILSLSPEQRQYWLGFDEWMAEQVARWATTSEKPLTVVDKFFAQLGRLLRELYTVFKSRFGLVGEPDAFVKDWLDSLVKEPDLNSLAVMRAFEDLTRNLSQKALISDGSPYVDAEPQTGATSLGRTVMHSLAVTSPAAKAMAAGADRFNRFYNLMLSMVQVADRNLHIKPLQRYREFWQMKQNERAEMMNESLETLKAWRRLGREPGDKLAGLIDDYMNLRYMTAAEHAMGVRRRPTQAEFAKLVRDNGVNDPGLQVFRKVVADFDRMLDRYEKLLIAEAEKITDLAQRAQKLTSIATQIANLRKQPYFPAMRFGDFTLTVRDAAGKVKHFETFEKARTRDKALKEIEKKLVAGETVHAGVLTKDAAPMIGLPPGLLDLMGEKLALSPTQQQALEQLRFEMSPAQSFKHRFQRKNRVEGYSQDFMRAYANYFFHGSNYFTKVKYVDLLREQVKAVRESARTLTDGTKRGQIANFLSDHLTYTMDPKPDFAALRSIMFTWALGFSPAAAALNLTQMFMGSYPFLASKFGDISTVAALGRAGTQVGTYYKKATLAGLAERDMRALNEAVKEGIISEAQAAELAAISEGNNLGKGFGGTHFERLIQTFLEKGAWMFEMTEQMNRRITFRAAWALASAKPGAKYVQEMVTKHALQYQRLRDSGWMEADAAAFVVAKDAVEATQFVYQQYAQPRFMRGKLRTIFIFKSFLQNTLFMLWNYPTAMVRSVLVMAALGGLMGIPGTEDLRGILKALGWKLFGKDFDVEEEARKLVLEITDGKVRPDILLHGMSRIGFGIPAAMDMLGVPLPQFDMSKSIGLGQISPVDIGQLLGPGGTASLDRAIASQTQRASGAAFGVGFNIYKAVTDGQLDWNDFKRWQSAVPRELGALTKSYRAFSEGRERNRAGNTVVRFDVNDAKQMMEVLGMAAGFQPTRLSAQWDRIIAEREAVQYWDLRKQGLLRQAWNARKTGDKESWNQVLGAIRKFNADLPKEARMKAITADSIRESFQTRARAANAQESGVPTQRSNIPIAREIQRLYPEAQVDVRIQREK